MEEKTLGQVALEQFGSLSWSEQFWELIAAAVVAAQRDERDATIAHLTARVTTLESTMRPYFEGYMLDEAHSVDNCIEPRQHHLAKQVEGVLDWTPAVCLDRIKAEALREMVEEIDAEVPIWTSDAYGTGARSERAELVNRIYQKAERLGSGATNG